MLLIAVRFVAGDNEGFIGALGHPQLLIHCQHYTCNGEEMSDSVARIKGWHHLLTLRSLLFDEIEHRLVIYELDLLILDLFALPGECKKAVV